MSRILFIDGSNIIMRCALGGELAPAEAVKIATNMIERATREFEASHLVIAMDFPGVPSWRKKLYPDYKAQRTNDTSAWLNAAAEHWVETGWWVEALSGFEADDIIATLATRAAGRPGTAVTVISGDSDLLPLMGGAVEVVKPVNGGRFQAVTSADVCARYGIVSPAHLVDLKALAGEAGDNVPGVAGVGPVRAGQLLKAYENLEGVIEAGQRNQCKYSIKVAASAEVARLSKQLVSLLRTVPIGPIEPGACAVTLGGAA